MKTSRFTDSHGTPIYKGIVLHFPALHSYTSENLLERQGHGVPTVMRRLLHHCFDDGPARAFVMPNPANSRIVLSRTTQSYH